MTDFRRELGQQLRVDSVRASAAAGSGHPTSSMSAADLIAVLIDGHLRADDHLIFSKGHASPLYYAMLKATGRIDDQELLTFRRLGSRLEGHPTPRIPPTDVATGSLGQGLPIAAGVALAGKRLDRLPFRVWCLCGDSEMAEGSMWEAFQHAAWEGLDNLVAIIDVNRLGQTRETMLGWDLDGYVRRLEAFGWHAIAVDGHDVEEIERAYAEAETIRERPTAIVARTLKGRGVKAVEDQPGKHGKPLDEPEDAIEELGGERDLRVELAPPAGGDRHRFETTDAELPTWELGEEVATRKAYGEALAALGSADGKVVALDGEVGNSTYAEIFTEVHPDRYFEMYIAEQQMVAAAVGMQVRGWTPFASSFAAFLSRAYDFVRMAAVSRARLCLSGSHAGVSIGEDGPSQMALEDVASLRAVHGSIVLHPADANATAQLLPAMAAHDGIAFLRTLRAATPVLYGPDDGFAVGGSKVPRSSDSDVATVVGMGITVHEALKAADALAAEGIAVRVVDAYSVKPLDAEAIRAAATATGAVVTVEDHWPEGGLGEAVAGALLEGGVSVPFVRLAVAGMPTSGKPDELLAAAGIDAAAIAEAVRGLVATPSSEERSA
jgi:transketolase